MLPYFEIRATITMEKPTTGWKANSYVIFDYYSPTRVVDGWVYGLSSGMVGFGSDNSRGVYDNIAVLVLPPEITFEGTEEFPDSDAAIAFVPSTGDWQMDGGRYNGAPSTVGTAAISLVDLGLDHGFEVASILEIKTTLNTENTAGLVFESNI